MERTKLKFGLALALIFATMVVLAFVFYPGDPIPERGASVELNDEAAVRKTVEDFGRDLKNVPLYLSPAETAAAIREFYELHVTGDLLRDWENNPDQALGREAVTPWPDRISLSSVQEISRGEYLARGEIVFVTGESDLINEEVAGRREIELRLVRHEDRWAISAVSMGEYRSEMVGWNNYEDAASGLEFRYPPALPTKYISLETAPPPHYSVARGPLSCVESEGAGGEPAVSRRVIGFRIYCVRASSEGAAGSTYTTYTYSTAWEEYLLQATFTLRYPVCANYPDREKEECERERQDFDLDALIERIVSTAERSSAPR